MPSIQSFPSSRAQHACDSDTQAFVTLYFSFRSPGSLTTKIDHDPPSCPVTSRIND